MSQINCYPETPIIFPFIVSFGQNTCPGNTNTYLSINCLTLFDRVLCDQAIKG